jgi:hypothetical protein
MAFNLLLIFYAPCHVPDKVQMRKLSVGQADDTDVCTAVVSSGDSSCCSSHALHNEILVRRPDLHKVSGTMQSRPFKAHFHMKGRSVHSRLPMVALQNEGLPPC